MGQEVHLLEEIAKHPEAARSADKPIFGGTAAGRSQQQAVERAQICRLDVGALPHTLSKVADPLRIEDVSVRVVAGDDRDVIDRNVEEEGADGVAGFVLRRLA